MQRVQRCCYWPRSSNNCDSYFSVVYQINVVILNSIFIKNLSNPLIINVIPVSVFFACIADMMDDSDIKHHDIVPGAAIQLEVWFTWKTLIKAAAEGEIDQVSK